MAEDGQIAPGAQLFRADIMDVWGGSPQGGIAPAKKSNSVLLYSDHTQGSQYGYRDGWLPDEGDGPVFEYTGQGTAGPQSMRLGNKAIRDHRAKGAVLRVFMACGRPKQKPQLFRYLGEFELDAGEPFFNRDASDIHGTTRTVIVFRLRPLGEVAINADDHLPPASTTSITKWRPHADQPPPSLTISRPIATERNDRTESQRRAVGPAEVRRREAELCRRFERHLEQRGHEVCRFEIRVEGERGILRTDTFDATDRVLYEAKGMAGRDEIRQAVGQLADYRRHVRPLRCAVLLPSRPSDDLRNLIESQGLELVYEDGGEFFDGRRRSPHSCSR